MLSSNRDTDCSHLTLHGRGLAESSRGLFKQKGHLIQCNWKHLTNNLCASGELVENVINVFVVNIVYFFCSLHATKQILVHFEDLPGDIIPEMIIFQYFLMCL